MYPAVDRSALSSYADVWEGYAEAFRFDSGSDHGLCAATRVAKPASTLGA